MSLQANAGCWFGCDDIKEAARKGDFEEVVEFVEAGVDLNAKDTLGNTALILASLHENSDIVQYLVQAGADVNARSVLGNTALMWAAYNGDLNTVQYLVQAGANVNARALGIIEYLAKGGVDVNELDDTYGITALDIAYYKERKSVIEYLESQGALKTETK